MAKNNKTRFFYVLYSDKTWVFDQSERAYYPIYIIKVTASLALVRRPVGKRSDKKCGKSSLGKTRFCYVLYSDKTWVFD